jgi:hypothetical protein
MGSCRKDIRRLELGKHYKLRSPLVQKMRLPVGSSLAPEDLGKKGHDSLAIIDAEGICRETLVIGQFRPAQSRRQIGKLGFTSRVRFLQTSENVGIVRTHFRIGSDGDRHLTVLSIEDLVRSETGGENHVRRHFNKAEGN